MKVNRRLLALVPLLVAATVLAMASTGSAAKVTAAKKVGGSITVWVDAVRLPDAQAYAGGASERAREHRHASTATATARRTCRRRSSCGTASAADGQTWSSANRSTTQSGWHPPAFKFAEPLNKGLISKSIISKWPATSTAQCTVNGVQYCIQDNLAPDVLWYNTKLMAQDGITSVPKTWQQWAADGAAAVAHGDIIGEIGESYGAWQYLWANQCPLEHFVGKKLEINSDG